jgi:hypothetical protein
MVCSAARQSPTQAHLLVLQASLLGVHQHQESNLRRQRYVEPLIGSDTINTMPDKTIQAFQPHGGATVEIRTVVPRLASLLPLAKCNTSSRHLVENRMKKLFALIAVASLAIGIAGCGKQQGTGTGGEHTGQSTQQPMGQNPGTGQTNQ